MLRDLQAGDPQVIGPYRLRGLLGVGGMGRVFLGLSADDQLVAVKVVRADLATDPEFRARFRDEVAVARKVSGPFTAPVVDADADGAVPWLATVYVAGPSLDDAVAERGPLPTWSVLRLAAGLAEGLSAIHAAGVVHRDLKPSNVLLARDGPRVIDFGISRASGAGALTRTGLLVGSPGFMSPEQAEDGEVGPPGDIFSLGAVLAFAATGEGPFGSGSTLALVYRVIHCPPDLDRVPVEVRGLVRRCLAKDPGLRPTAREVLAETNAVRSVNGSLPEPVTRVLIRQPAPGVLPGAGTPPLPGVLPGAGTPPVPGVLPDADTAPVPAHVPGPHPAPGAEPGPVLTGQALVAPDLPPLLAAAQPGASGAVPSWSARDEDAQVQGRPGWRRSWRALVAAAAIAALAGAAAAAGVTLASAHHTSHAAQSAGRAAAVEQTSPVTVPPPSADPRTSRPAPAAQTTSPPAAASAAAPMSASAAAPVHTDPPVVDFTRPATTHPPAPSHSASPAPPSPTRTAAPPPNASPTPTASPAPTSGGY